MACVTSSLACSRGGWSSGFSVKPIMGKTDAWVIPHRVNPKVSPKREVTLSTSLAKERASHTGEITRTGKESNWIQTAPGKGWFAILRLYSPLEPWFDKTWRPGGIELLR